MRYCMIAGLGVWFGRYRKASMSYSSAPFPELSKGIRVIG